ncbi:repetitive proline-rich cell wall protein 1-like [Cucumis sativus]|uniref:ATP-dependent RNA helicase DBP7 n=1 Tax=Cucumis sativus TaxID=3659 RepID=A0A0A0KWW0_CUCSA|nr:repetitive proline-rich cell wall protein 1-like [Cucumis sativus]KGN52301.1 hypothetical protein Csa_007763 [Cucumis sativus]
MKTACIFLGILLSFLLLVNFCYAAEESVTEFQSGKGAAGVTAKNGEEEDEKFKFLLHHKPYYKKPFLKPIPYKHPFLKKPIPVHPFHKKPIVFEKKPLPVHPFFKKPIDHPPVFHTHP